MSLTDEAASPTKAPISDNVIPFRRKSEMRDDHVLMPSTLRDSVGLRQRHPVTVFRQNRGMASELDKLTTIGSRVRYWREKRGMSRVELAERVGAGRESTISDLELGKTKKGTFLGPIAQALGLSLDYVLRAEGEPELNAAPLRESSKAEAWLFPNVPRSKLDRLDKIERSYMETKMLDALAEIEEARKRHRTG